jgi:hypothetical protein
VLFPWLCRVVATKQTPPTDASLKGNRKTGEEHGSHSFKHGRCCGSRLCKSDPASCRKYKHKALNLKMNQETRTRYSQNAKVSSVATIVLLTSSISPVSTSFEQSLSVTGSLNRAFQQEVYFLILRRYLAVGLADKVPSNKRSDLLVCQGSSHRLMPHFRSSLWSIGSLEAQQYLISYAAIGMEASLLRFARKLPFD